MYSILKSVILVRKGRKLENMNFKTIAGMNRKWVEEFN